MARIRNSDSRVEHIPPTPRYVGDDGYGEKNEALVEEDEEVKEEPKSDDKDVEEGDKGGEGAGDGGGDQERYF